MPVWSYKNSMPKKPLNLTIEERVLQYADAIQEKCGYSSRVSLVEELIRNKYEHLFGTMALKEEVPPWPANSDDACPDSPHTLPPDIVPPATARTLHHLKSGMSAAAKKSDAGNRRKAGGHK